MQRQNAMHAMYVMHAMHSCMIDVLHLIKL
jgi:hypothetical protein